jgi:ribulose-bisphosphate carboxylase large chain
MERINVSYHIETPDPAEKVAGLMAKMQSTGTWKEVAGETAEIIKKHGAEVVSVTNIGVKDRYELPTRYPAGKKVNCADIVISYPVINFGAKISMLLTTVAGEIFDMAELTAIKVTDIEMPREYSDRFPGPKFGIEGCREITGAVNRPFFGAITKPCVGISPKEISRLAYEASRAGADFIKDDELLADAPYNSIHDRTIAVAEGLKKAYEETGHTTMYALNITDDPDKVLGLHDLVVKHGGRALMFNVMTGGFNTLNMLARHTQLPIHCHRDFAVASIRSQYLGISSLVFTKLTRMCGGDQIQCGGLGGYLYEKDEEMLENMQACLAPMGKLKKTMPVSSGGMWAGKLKYNLEKIGNNDFMFLCGGGVFGHPDGGYAGMRSLFEAWDEYNGKAEGINLKRAKQEFK